MSSIDSAQGHGDKRYTRRLLRYALPYWPWFVLALAIIFAIVWLELYQPRILGTAVDTFLSKYETAESAGFSSEALRQARAADLWGIVKLGITYLLTVVAIMGLSYAQAAILATVGQKIIYNLRTEIFAHLHRLHIGFFNDNPIGRLVTRVTNDCETVNEMFTSVIVNILKSCFVLIGVVATMLSFQPKLSLAIFSVIPIIAVFSTVFRRTTRKFYRDIRGRISELNAFIAEHVSGMKLVQLFNAEKPTMKSFSQQSEELRRANMRQLMAFSLYSPTSYVLNISALAILLFFGGRMAAAGTITIGTLVIFQRYIEKFFDPIQELAEQFDVIQSATASAERIFWLLDTEPQVVDAPDALHMPSFRGEIEFKNVWFAYRDQEWVLRDVSFKMTPGQRIAFVGATGAGKTTIQSLICRYYDIQQGEILIDGVDVRRIRLADLRRNIGQMLQDVFLFTGDVRSNIRLSESAITQEDIVTAAKTVNAHGFIEKLEDGYGHRVIERGGAFSAGQRQLLSFARTLAFKPSVLILDEATANIDTETEALIQDALGKMVDGRSTIIVAHRLSTIQNCDKIIVLHKGQLCEEGTHQELLARGGIYYKLYKLQYEHDEKAGA